jgi:hypothetical protein
MEIHPALRQPAVLLTAAALLGAGVTGVYSLVRERRQTHVFETEWSQAQAERSQALSALSQARGEIQQLSTRVDALTQAQAARPASTPARRTAARAQPARPREDPRFTQLQTQISAQQKELTTQQQQLVQTREDLSKAQDNLQGELHSTRDELSGSIAKNHDELVVLQRRGERNYYEFNLNKSKEVQHVGPVGLALRKSNVKHKNYNMDLMVQDNRLEKKNVSLYEPVLINLADRPQPVEVVVNFISKDMVRGYVSEPKYKRSELAESTPAPAAKPLQFSTR